MSKNQLNPFDVTLQTIAAASQLPLVRVDREEFLKNHFKDSPYLDKILADGPQSVYTVDSLQIKAEGIINDNTNRVALLAFGLGLPGGLLAAPLAVADISQFFASAINLAQQLAYLYGEDDLFEKGKNNLSDEATNRVILYLGAMFGVSGVNALMPHVAKHVGEHIGKQVIKKPLMKTAWYPILKQVGRVVGVRITRETLKKGVAKFVPVVGGVISGGLTYASFKPMGQNLSKTLAQHLKGEFDVDLSLNPDFLAELQSQLDKEIEDAEFLEKA